MDDQDLNALLDGDSAETTAESATETTDPVADVTADAAASDASEPSSVEAASDAGAEMSADPAADLAADMMGEAGPAEASAETRDEAPISEATGKDSEKTGEPEKKSTAKSDNKGPANLDERLQQELGFANLYLRDCESLILFRVFNKVHIAYYQAWVRDARGAMALISSLRRRRQRHLNALAKAAKKDTESAA